MRIALCFLGFVISGAAGAQVVDVPPQVVHDQNYHAWLELEKAGCGVTYIARLEPPLSPLSLIVGDSYSIDISDVIPPTKALDWSAVWIWKEKRGRDGSQQREHTVQAVSTVQPGQTYKIFLIRASLPEPHELTLGEFTDFVDMPDTVSISVAASPFRAPDNPEPQTRNLIEWISRPDLCATVAQSKFRIATLRLRVVRRLK